ncbi:MAG: hypothetical protein IPM46_10420 [Flavobacteriales bacterium]|nr:hypothetical protein [Flavobacteriales bacterium]
MLFRGTILMLVSSLGNGPASAQRSLYNGLHVQPADSTGHYRILIGGHFHGESTNRSGFPASTLLANLDTINSLGAHLFISTGDLFMNGVKDRPRYTRSLFSKLRVPLFNAPGNHDLDGAVGDETAEIGQLRQGQDLIFILNTEAHGGSLSRKAQGRLAGALEAEQGFLPSRVFIISHRPIWAEDDPLYSGLFKDNTRSLTGTNFQKEVYPILQEIAEHAEVYWISGSLGGQAPSSIFFQRHAPNITYIQCAIRDEPRDALLIADVQQDTVKWSALSLTRQQLLAPEAYDAAWWRNHGGRGEGFKWRLLPYIVKKTMLNAAFWWGAAFALLLVFLVRRMWWRS